jgi:hypothetical protein
VRRSGRAIALASERHHAWLRERGAVPVAYGDGVGERIAAAGVLSRRVVPDSGQEQFAVQ